MQTLMSVEFMLARAISRDADEGIYEATCILTQCCLWLGSEVSRHLRLSAVSGSGLNGFSFALTADQKRTVTDQKSRHEVLGLRVQLKTMAATIDQRLGRMASSLQTLRSRCCSCFGSARSRLASTGRSATIQAYGGGCTINRTTIQGSRHSMVSTHT